MIDGESLATPSPLNPAMLDVAMLLLFGASSIDSGIPEEILAKCMLGSLLGDKPSLSTFVRQRYIWVSRITGGATANSLGYLVQDYAKEKLQGMLPDWDFSRKTIPGISQNAGRTETSFDIVAMSPHQHYCAIEVSFQVTTNSTIERKAGQAQARQEILRQGGYKIAYILDGAGNFQRTSALTTLCQYGDCVVACTEQELQTLADFLRNMDS